MDVLGGLWQVLNFFYPAAALGLIAAGAAKLVWRRELRAVRWSRLARPAVLACSVVLIAGLVVTGHDGRMATYAAMVAVCALTLWWRGFGPGRR